MSASEKIRTAVVLAGGFGTRLRSVVSDLPKPMAMVSGRHFLEYLLDYWIDQGISEFIICVSYLSDKIISHFGNNYCGATIKYSIEKVALGTGGAIIAAQAQIKEDFLVLNGDTFFPLSLSDLSRFHFDNHAACTLALFQSNDSSRYLPVEIFNGKVISFTNKNLVENFYVNGGVYIFSQDTFKLIEFKLHENYSLESDIFPLVLDTGLLFGLPVNAPFIDIGLPADYLRAQEILIKYKNYEFNRIIKK